MGKRISELPAGTTVAGTEIVPAVQSGVTVSLTAQQIVRGGLTNTRLAKTALYTVANADKGKTIALGGAAFYALTFNAAAGYDADFAVLVLNEDSGRAKDISINGVGTRRLYPLTSMLVYNQNNTWQVHGFPPRWPLTAATTFFVRTDGNDSNDGLANNSGGAFLTVQQFVNTVCAKIDLAGFNLSCQIADGTYSGAITLGPYVGRAVQGHTGPVSILGNSGNHSAVLFSTASNCITAAETGGLEWDIKNIKLTSSGAACIVCDATGWIVGDGCVFGSAASLHGQAENGGILEFTTSYDIVAGAVVHIYAVTRGMILYPGGQTVTVTGTPAFSAFFAGADTNGLISATAVTWTGAATGTRYSALNGGGIMTSGGGANYFPGDAPGSATSPGWYA